jgi:hypothetical protein
MTRLWEGVLEDAQGASLDLAPRQRNAGLVTHVDLPNRTLARVTAWTIGQRWSGERPDAGRLDGGGGDVGRRDLGRRDFGRRLILERRLDAGARGIRAEPGCRRVQERSKVT